MPRLKKSDREKFLECVSVRTVYGRIEKPTRFNNGLKYVVTVSVAVMPVQLPV